MRGLEARLQRLEQATNHQSRSREDPELNADFACLGSLELRRGCDALKAGIDGDEARAAEARNLLILAHARRLEGWTQADRDALKKQDDEKQDAVWRLTHTLGERHKAYPDVRRFDVLDVTEPEIRQLVEVAETATCAGDLDAVAGIVGRLRLDGKVMDMATFEGLVLRGELAPAPQPDWLDFRRPPSSR
jgi:hypothetical protein